MAASTMESVFEALDQVPRTLRLGVVAGIHLVLFTLAYYSAFLIRFDFEIPAGIAASMWQGLLVVLATKVAVFGLLKMFQGWSKYVSLYDVIALAHALAICAVVFMLVNTFVLDPPNFPRSIYLLDYCLSLVFVGAVRGTMRLIREASVNRGGAHARPVNLIIAGAGDTGDLLVREIVKNGNLRYRPVAFIDDDPNKQGMRIHGIPVAGPISALPQLAEKHQAEQVIIAMPSASRQQIRQVVDIARRARVETKILPAVEAILQEDVSLNQLREVSISDLLGREPVRLDLESLGRFLQGRRVLVTGAGGSIGSELCRQVLRFEPGELVMVENGETPLFYIHRELSAQYSGRLVPYIASVFEKERLRTIFQRHQPEIIIHAAAYKHVPLMEQHPSEAVKNNIVGTRNLADLAAEFRASSFVLISTDKAVNPTSVMGATKRVTELYIQNLGRQHPDTKFCAVRFGNVLGSNGSVVPLFREQIRRGGPVTVTHPEMTRYFMTIPEAVQLVLQAAAFERSGEVFILDMGEPVKIADLARDMIRLSGMSEDEIPIVYSGMRPGEKLFEELTLDEEEVDTTSHSKIFIGKHVEQQFDSKHEAFAALIEAGLAGQDLEVRRLLKALVPTYDHPEIPENVVSFDTGKHRIVNKM